jgi:hypothetical protein
MIQQLWFGTRLFQLLWTARPVVTAWLTPATLIALVFLMVPNSLAAQTLGHEVLRRELATAVGQIKQKLDN